VFMTLSGYLFAKLLDGKRLIYHLFIWNRLLRLLPLLVVVVLVNSANEYLIYGNIGRLLTYLYSMLKGFIFPVWPNGGWSIAVELHFYLLLPFLLYKKKSFSVLPCIFLAIALILRALFFLKNGEVQSIAYLTIFGRIDQFVFGILSFRMRGVVRGSHISAMIVTVFFSIFYCWFDGNGGFFRQPNYPSPSEIWVYMPAIEGASIAFLIAWYDNSFDHTNNNNIINNILALIGKYSYSIYLLHFYFIFLAADFINRKVVEISNFYIALPVSIILLIMIIPLAHLSYKFIEQPFLKLRKKYTVNPGAQISLQLATPGRL
jgi:peptidoglycan/LPS O-acetylase OafA/YrhL